VPRLALRDLHIACDQALGRREAHVEDLRRVLAEHRGASPALNRRGERVLSRESTLASVSAIRSEQRQPVPVAESARRRIQLAHTRLGRRAAEHDDRQLAASAVNRMNRPRP